MVASKYASVNMVIPLGTSLNASCELGSGLTWDTGIRGGRPYVTLSHLPCVRLPYRLLKDGLITGRSSHTSTIVSSGLRDQDVKGWLTP